MEKSGSKSFSGSDSDSENWLSWVSHRVKTGLPVPINPNYRYSRRTLDHFAFFLIRDAGIPLGGEFNYVYDAIRNEGFAGFAEYYLQGSLNEKKKRNVRVYQKLVEIDYEFGTSFSDQLWSCINQNADSELIKVGLLNHSNII